MKYILSLILLITQAAIASDTILGNTDPQSQVTLVKELEARELKAQIVNKRKTCFHDSANAGQFKQCYEEEVAQLVAKECRNIRNTESILQRDCEDFLYRIVMEPNSIFPEENVSFQKE